MVNSPIHQNNAAGGCGPKLEPNPLHWQLTETGQLLMGLAIRSHQILSFALEATAAGHLPIGLAVQSHQLLKRAT
jgi:hypothetical protein